DVHATSEGINARANFGTRSGSQSRDNRGSGFNSGVGVGQNESSRVSERRHEAMATVRLVNRDGDVIWSTTQESLGAKFRGSSADVADKITKRLVEEYEKAKRLRSK